MARIYIYFAVVFLGLSTSVFGAKVKAPSEKPKKKLEIKVNPYISDKTQIWQEIDQFIEKLPPEEAWADWVVEHGPIHGNYCGAAHGDINYEVPCVSRIDCICKLHDFGYSLRRFREADKKMLEQILHQPVVTKGNDPDYDTFLQMLGLSLFAGKIIGKDLTQATQKLVWGYEKDPVKARKTLDQIIDENEVFRQKIHEIEEERLQFETQAQVNPELNFEAAVNPYLLARGVLEGNFEYKASKYVSIQAYVKAVGIALGAQTEESYLNDDQFGGYLGFGTKYFVWGEALKKGVFIEPRAVFGIATLPKDVIKEIADDVVDALNKRDPDTAPATLGYGGTLSLLGGYHRVFPVGFSFELKGGIGYHIGRPFADIVTKSPLSGFIPQFHLFLGWAF